MHCMCGMSHCTHFAVVICVNITQLLLVCKNFITLKRFCFFSSQKCTNGCIRILVIWNVVRYRPHPLLTFSSLNLPGRLGAGAKQCLFKDKTFSYFAGVFSLGVAKRVP